MKYPIAETFYSLQGEGLWTGTPMYFIRLAGCNVGKYETWPLAQSEPFPVVQDKELHMLREKTHSVCTTHSGERFLCDTDYHRTEWLEAEDSLGGHPHVCITGGEPFLHDLTDLIATAHLECSMVHIETSGTKSIPRAIGYGNAIWITCCPKEGFLIENYDYPDEWKFLAGPAFDPKSVIDFLQAFDPRPVFIQPINGVNEPDEIATARVRDIVLQHPQWRLSAQLHKYLKVR